MTAMTGNVYTQQPAHPVAPAQTATGTVGGTPAPPKPITQAESAADLLTATLKSWGLSSMLPYVKDYLTKGYDSTTINLYLQDTPEWKQRFAGNEARKAKGLSVLSPAQYIATEEQYRNVMQSYGLPPGFYDSHSDFNQFIGDDISPTEISDRAKIAHDQYIAAPAEQKQLWQSYGFTKGDAIAGILDPSVATAVIQDRSQQVQLGGAALAQGINVSQQRAQTLQQHGTTLDQARGAYAQMAQYGQTDQSIGSRFGVGADSTGAAYGSQAEEENRLLLGLGANAARSQVANDSERGLFHATAGASQQALGVSQELSATNF